MAGSIPISAIILGTVVKATLLLALAWGATLLLKRRSAAARHMVQACALAGLLLLPFSALVLPAWHIKGIPDFAGAAATSTTAKTSAAPGAVTAARLKRIELAPASPVDAATAASPRHAQRNPKRSTAASAAIPPVNPGPAQAIESSEAREPANGATQSRTTAFMPGSAPTSARLANFSALLILVWISGALFFLARWKLNASHLSGLVRRAAVLTDSGWNAHIRALAAQLSIDRHVALLISDEIEVPITTGLMFPKIVLSPDYAEWSAGRRSAILNHELAHIRRLDVLAQGLAQIAVALYWFHPLVWLMARAMRAEAERACDDQVLASGTKASDYAHELLDIVSELRGPELAAALAMARRSQLEGRVLAVLNPALRRSAVSAKAAAGIAVLTLAIVLPLAALRPAPQQAATTPAKGTNQKKPSPASTPATSLQPNSSSTPASAPAARPSDSEQVEPAEAPEPPEPAEPAEPAEAPEPPEPAIAGVPAVPSVPAVPAVPAVPGVPGVPAVPAVPAVPGGDLTVCGEHTRMHNMNMQSDDGHKRWTATWSGDDCSVELRSEGDIKFTAEATAIQSISAGGYFEVYLRQGDTLKQVKVTPSANGLQYIYKVNGAQQPFEGEAKTWFSQFLLSLERSTGFAAEARVPALLAKGGPTAVLDEISNLQSDYVRGLYFRKLLEQPNLPSPVVQRVIKQAGEQVHSDYELARVLMTVGKQYDLPDEASRTAFLTAANSLKSDYEHSRVLIELLRRPNISKENVSMALNSANSIKSDYEKSRILLSLLDQKSFEQSQLDFYLKLVSSIHSDYEKSRDLLAPMQKYKLAADQINRIMDATTTMSSDYEKSRLLLGLVKQGKFDEAQMTNYLKVVDSMQSDYERSRTLLELMQNNNLSPASVTRALQAISRAQSDYEKSRGLTTVVKASKFDESQMSAYLAVMDSMQSDFERSRCILTLLQQTKLSNASMAKVIESVSKMKSDYEKSRVLLAVAQSSPLEGTLRESYLKAANSINSEFERNRALAAVVKRATL